MEPADMADKEPGIHQHQRRQPLAPLQRCPHSLRSPPVLTDDDKTAELELVQQRHQIRNVMRQGERGIHGWMVRVARPHPVRDDHTIASFGQWLEEVTIEETPGRVPMQQEHGPCRLLAFVYIGYRAAVHLHCFLLPGEHALEPLRLWP